MEIEFIASLPDIMTAISIGGDGATRVKFDIPESEIANAVKLVLLKGQAFKVKIETIEQEDFGIKIENVKRLSNDTLLQVTVSLPPKR